MRPKKHETTGSGDLFRARLDQIINMRHAPARCARAWRGDPLFLDPFEGNTGRDRPRLGLVQVAQAQVQYPVLLNHPGNSLVAHGDGRNLVVGDNPLRDCLLE